MKKNAKGNVPVEIRSGVSFNDFATVYSVFESFPFNECWTESEVEEEYNDHMIEDAEIYGFYLDGKCVAIISLRPPIPKDNHPTEFPSNAKVMYISNIATLFEYRNMGIGTHLFKHALMHSKVLGYDIVYLRTNDDNSMSRGIAEKQGFRKMWDVCQEITRKRTNGENETDLRIFLSKRIRKD